MVEDANGRRRQRRRATARQGPAPQSSTTQSPTTQNAATKSRTPPTEPPKLPGAVVEPAQPERAPKPRRENRTGAAAAKGTRGDRDLVGSGSSQVGPTGAMRARDLNRPTPEDLAEAEASLDIVRRHWTPTTEQPEPRPARRRSR